MPGEDGPRRSGRSGYGSARPIVSIATMLLGAAGEVLRELGTGQPQSTGRWVLLLTGALIGSTVLVLAAGLFDRLIGWVAVSWAWLRSGNRRGAALAMVLVCLLALPVGYAIPVGADRLHRYLHGCPEPTEVRVLTSIEQYEPARELADEFQDWTASRNGGCATVNLFVYAATPPVAEQALAQHWGDALQKLGPHPDVWLADSTVELARLRARAPQSGFTLPVPEHDGVTSIATSPVVLAVPARLASTEAEAARTPAGWNELWRIAQQRGWPVVRPDLETSVTGELGTTAHYQSGQKPDLREIERRLDAPGYPIGASTDLLCQQRVRGAAAVITTEQQMIRFNQGRGLGGACGAPTDPPPPPEQLVAFYPADTLSTDHPLVRLLWDGPDSPQARATLELSRWLSGKDGKRALERAGLRPTQSADVGDPFLEQNGVLISPPYRHEAPTLEAVNQVRADYTEARRPGRVLFAVDVSRSMATVDGGGGDRFQHARAAILKVLGSMGAADEVGLWTFPNGAAVFGEQVPVGPRDSPVPSRARRDLVGDKLNGIGPTGGTTPLYAMIVQGVQALESDQTNPLSSLVVLTDGVDSGGAGDPFAVAGQVKERHVRVYVVAIGEASCSDPTLHLVTHDTGGDCREAPSDSVDGVLGDLVHLIWRGSANGP